MFITFEGGDGSGKSTQIQRLADTLRQRGIAVCVTREPGGCATAEILRQIVLFPPQPWQAQTTLLLMLAARVEHVHHTIVPALQQGQWVLCDRFTDSTRAYQSAGLGMPRGVVDMMTELLKIPNPDLTFILDVPVEISQQRRQERQDSQDIFEQQQADFHQRIRQAFLDIAGENPQRCRVIKAQQSLEKVAAEIFACIDF
jgi:dTMP kinase